MYAYKICYVLVDDHSGYYSNQLLLSLYSLRSKGFDGEVYIATDRETLNISSASLVEIALYDVSTIIVEVPEEYGQKEKSRYIKTSLRQHIDGDVLYIDTDTIIAARLPEIASDAELAMVKDANRSMDEIFTDVQQAKETQLGKYMTELMNKCGYKWYPEDDYFNGGVIWMKDTPMVHHFFEEWHKGWNSCRRKGVLYDQPSLNDLNHRMPGRIDPLDGKWNVQVYYAHSILYLNQALIIHYYNIHRGNYDFFALADPKIQSEGINGRRVREIIENPNGAIRPSDLCRTSTANIEIMQTAVFGGIAHLYRKERWLFDRLNNFIMWCSKIKKRGKSLRRI